MKILHAKRLFLPLLAIVALHCSPALAQKPAVLPDLTYKRLLNDLQIIVASTPNMGDTISIGLVVRYGSSFDPADRGGLTNLVTHMFGKATIDRTAKDIQDELKYLGATLEMESDWDGIRFLVHTPNSQYERALLLLYQVVGEAQFTEDDFAKVKAEILQEIDKPVDPRQRIRTTLETTLFRGTTYGRTLTGSRASLQNITLGDVRLYYRRYFSAGASSLVIVGSVPVPQLLQKATRIWGVWVRKDEVPFTFLPPKEPSSRNLFVEDDPGSPAAQFILGGLFPRRDDPAFYPAILAARILQDRLTNALPTSLVTVGVDGRRLPGLFYVQGQAAADQAVGEIRKIGDAVEAFKESGISAEELTGAQTRWIKEFNDGLNSVDGISKVIMDSELYRLGTNFAATFPDLVQRSTPDMVKEAAREWIFPGGVVIVVRGPAAVLKAELESLGSVQQVGP